MTIIFLSSVIIVNIRYWGCFNLVNAIAVLLSIFLIIFNYDFSHPNFYKEVHYENLDSIRYVFSILVIILHVRPFLGVNEVLDIIFNNLISRICVPFFFFLTSYFIGIKSQQKDGQIVPYIRSCLSLYLVWSSIYLPLTIMWIKIVLQYGGEVVSILQKSPIVFIPLGVIVLLMYSGVYYHLWYFPALFCALFIVHIFQKRWSIKWLVVISFVLLIIGASESYYGFLPQSVQSVVDYYFRYLITTRNFLFFGLFYVALGYSVGKYNLVYPKNCCLKMVIAFMFLVVEVVILQHTYRLDSNILISCTFLVYYLFVFLIRTRYSFKANVILRELSKYYYLIHPLVIFVVTFLFKNNKAIVLFPFIMLATHYLSIICIRIKKKHPKYLI